MSEEAGSATTVRVHTAGRGAEIVLDRPPLHILDLATLHALDQAVATVAELEGLQWVVVRSEGTRAFSAGVAIEDHVPETIPTLLAVFHRALRRLFALEPPTLAAVDGHCLGGGMELALACDLVLASERSRFGQPEIALGCFPPVAAALLPRRIGPGPALDLVLTGRTITARRAAELGLVTRLVPDGALAGAVEELCSELSAHSAVALRLAKKAARAGMPEGELFERALAEAERIYVEELARSEDMAEGVDAFLEKRPPQWRHA